MRGHLTHRYLLALGSNQRVAGVGGPRQVVKAAALALEEAGLIVAKLSPVITSVPLGPSSRRYANAAAVVESDCPPPALLAILQQIERAFGRTRRGARWRARTLDLDIILWQAGAAWNQRRRGGRGRGRERNKSAGIWASDTLKIPHPEFRKRAFVLAPGARIAGDWRDPHSRTCIRHLHARLTRPRPLP